MEVQIFQLDDEHALDATKSNGDLAGMEWCGNSEQLPPFGKLEFLKHLSLDGMSGARCIGNFVYRDHEENPFTSLESLHLDSLKSLEQWTPVTEDGFPRLGEV